MEVLAALHPFVEPYPGEMSSKTTATTKNPAVLRSLFLIFQREEIIGPKGKSFSGYFYINRDTNLFMKTMQEGFLNKRSSTQ